MRINRIREAGTDSKGRIVFSAGRMFFFLALILTLALSASFNAHAGNSTDEEEEEEEDYQEIKTIRWQAALTSDLKVSIKGKKYVLKKGTKVVVTNRRYGKPYHKSTILVKGYSVKVANSKLYFIKDLCSSVSEGDYNKVSKEYFVNVTKNFPSRTKYLVWISLDKQRVNVFKGWTKGGHWKLIKVFLCSTGKAQTPTSSHWNADVSFKSYRYTYFQTGGVLYYFTEVSGSGMHKWPGGGMSSCLGKKTVSHGCIRMSERDAKWVFDNVPVKTRVVVW